MAPAGKLVKVLEVCKVAPPPGSVPSASLSLSFLDLLWLPLPPPQSLFFYDFPHPTTHFINTLLPRIKHSLSLTLQHFYPLAGNLSWSLDSDKPMIHYVESDSVSLTVAESDGDFHHLSGKQAREANESHPLVPHLPVSEAIVPPLALQVTVFPNSGICFGLIFHHAIADGKAAMHFMKSWASICKFGNTSLSTVPLPFYDRTVIQDPDGIEKIYLNELVKFMPAEPGYKPKNRRFKVMDLQVPPNTVRATFQLSRAHVARLKECVLALCKKDEHTLPIHVSTFVVTCAYIWICSVKAGRDECNNMTRFVITVDCRSRLDPPIPAMYFGNCVRGCVVTGERSDMVREDGIAVAAQLIGEAIRGLGNGLIMRGIERSMSKLLTLQSGRALVAAGSTRLGLYETDFGWGRPKKVELISIDRTGAIFLADSCNEDGGVEIGLTLDKQEMEAFAFVFVDGLNAL